MLFFLGCVVGSVVATVILALMAVSRCGDCVDDQAKRRRS